MGAGKSKLPRLGESKCLYEEAKRNAVTTFVSLLNGSSSFVRTCSKSWHSRGNTSFRGYFSTYKRGRKICTFHCLQIKSITDV